METYLNQQNKLRIESNIFVTSKYAAAGTILLTQAPLALVPLPSERLHRCNYCLRKGNLQCCSRCHSAYFCSNDCFLKAWIQFHRGLCDLYHRKKEESPEIAQLTNKSLDINQWLLERAALTVNSHNSLKSTTAPTIQQLSMDAFQKLKLQPTTKISDNTLQFLQKSVDRLNCTLNQLSEFWQRIQISSFSITDPDMHLDPVAVGIYPITSQYVRHSCRPNACLIYKQGHQLLVALEDIPENTPITISYVDLMATKKQRQNALADRFGFSFECDCARCQGEFQGLDELFERGEALDTTPEEIERALEEQLKSWSVLEMVKEYAAKDFDAGEPSAEDAVALDVPHLAHFICRMIAPDIYVPAFSRIGKKSAAAFYYNRLPPLLQKDYSRQDDARRILPAIDALLQRTPHSPFLTITGIKVAEKWLAKLVSEGRWVEASRCTIYLYMVYRLVYSTLHPNMVYHTLVLSRASWNSLVQLELAGIGKKLERVYQNAVRLWIEVARNSILKTFGQETSLWREVVEIKWLFERDQKLK